MLIRFDYVVEGFPTFAEGTFSENDWCSHCGGDGVLTISEDIHDCHVCGGSGFSPKIRKFYFRGLSDGRWSLDIDDKPFVAHGINYSARIFGGYSEEVAKVVVFEQLKVLHPPKT